MFLTGLTLEVRGMAASAEEPSLIMLEIAFPSPGLRGQTWAWTNVGPVRTSGIGWIEGKLYLPLHRSNVDYEFQRTNWLASYAEPYGRSVATALGWEP